MDGPLTDTPTGQARASTGRASKDPQRGTLEFIAAHTFATEDQVALVLDSKQHDHRSILGSLTAQGLIRRAAAIREQLAVAVTADGLALLQSKMPLPRSQPRRYWQDYGAGWLWAAAHRGRFGDGDYYSRRQMQELDATTPVPDPDALNALSETVRAKLVHAPFAIRLAGCAGTPQVHYPDLTLVQPTRGRVCMEVLFTAPSRDWLDEVLRGYIAKPSIAAIIFMVESAPVRAAIEAAARRVGAQGVVYVQPFRISGGIGYPSKP